MLILLQQQKRNTLAVVVTYNRKELLLQCIEKLLTQRGAECDVLIVDNNSTDGTGEAVQHIQSAKLHYYNTGKNIGGAGGFHIGMQIAVKEGYHYAWVMDDDTLPQSDALSELLAADVKLNGNYGFLSSRVLWTDGSLCKMNEPKTAKVKDFVKKSSLASHDIYSVKQASFVSLLIPTAIIQRVGLPISEFFIWGDDVEYTRRIAVRNMIPCYLVGRSYVIHAMKSNVGSNIARDTPERIQRYRYAFRNENYIYRQEGLRGISYYYLKCVYNLLRVLFTAKEQRIQRCKVVLSEMFLGLTFNPTIQFPEH